MFSDFFHVCKCGYSDTPIISTGMALMLAMRVSGSEKTCKEFLWPQQVLLHVAAKVTEMLTAFQAFEEDIYVIFWIPASMKTERCACCVCFTFRKCESANHILFFFFFLGGFRRVREFRCDPRGAAAEKNTQARTVLPQREGISESSMLASPQSVPYGHHMGLTSGKCASTSSFGIKL